MGFFTNLTARLSLAIGVAGRRGPQKYSVNNTAGRRVIRQEFEGCSSTIIQSSVRSLSTIDQSESSTRQHHDSCSLCSPPAIIGLQCRLPYSKLRFPSSQIGRNWFCVPFYEFHRNFSKRRGDQDSFLCFECSKTFKNPDEVSKHYKEKHLELFKGGVTCRSGEFGCGAFFSDEEAKRKHGCILKTNETLPQFKKRMKKAIRRYGQKRYRCPTAGCANLSFTPLEHHEHHNERHI